MMTVHDTFSSFSVDDMEQAKVFYTQVLNFTVQENPGMGLDIDLPGGGRLFIYQKDDHIPATFTVLNLVVENIDTTVDELVEKGVSMERYDMGKFVPDEKGIYRSEDPTKGPTIAWFTDSAGNVLSLIERDDSKVGEEP